MAGKISSNNKDLGNALDEFKKFTGKVDKLL